MIVDSIPNEEELFRMLKKKANRLHERDVSESMGLVGTDSLYRTYVLTSVASLKEQMIQTELLQHILKELQLSKTTGGVK